VAGEKDVVENREGGGGKERDTARGLNRLTTNSFSEGRKGGGVHPSGERLRNWLVCRRNGPADSRPSDRHDQVFPMENKGNWLLKRNLEKGGGLAS